MTCRTSRRSCGTRRRPHRCRFLHLPENAQVAPSQVPISLCFAKRNFPPTNRARNERKQNEKRRTTEPKTSHKIITNPMEIREKLSREQPFEVVPEHRGTAAAAPPQPSFTTRISTDHRGHRNYQRPSGQSNPQSTKTKSVSTKRNLQSPCLNHRPRQPLSTRRCGVPASGDGIACGLKSCGDSIPLVPMTGLVAGRKLSNAWARCRGQLKEDVHP